jgi:hypothetical protein
MAALGGISTTTRGELLAHVEFKNVGHLPASQVKSLLKFTASDDGDWSPPHVDDKDLRPAGFCRSGSASRRVVKGLKYPNPGRSTCMHGGGSPMWMASVKAVSRIFAIATTPKSEKPKPVAAWSFAKRAAVTTNMGTMQIKGLAARAARATQGAQDAVAKPANGTCPWGWTASGSFCLRSGSGGR